MAVVPVLLRTRSRMGAVLLVAAVGACSDELPGHYFTVELVTARDESNGLLDNCQDPPQRIEESYTYRVVLDGPTARVYIGDDLLGTGSLDVCRLSYASPTWSTAHGGGSVRWSVVGSAQVGLDAGCADGWDGTERLTVAASSDPDVPDGCTVVFDVNGTYDGEVR